MFNRRRQPSLPWRDSALRHETLEELIRAVAVAPDASALRLLVARRFQAVAGCDAVWFLEFDRGGQSFSGQRLERGQPVETGENISWCGDGPLATWLRVNEEPLVFPGRSGIDSYLDDDERRQLEANGIRACVPVFAVGTLRATILLESHDVSWELTPDLSGFLMACGRHIGLAYENIERYEAQVGELKTAAHAQRLAVAGQLASMVAHEVRNPLGIIRSSIQIVKDSDEGWEKRETLLTDAISEIDRISDTIAGFLSLSRPSTLHEEAVDLVDVIDSAIRVINSYASGRQVDIHVLNEFPSLRLLGDPRELRQVFLNVLLNSTQAIEGPGTIRIRTSLFDEARRDGSGHRTMILVAISDSGPGISASVVETLFEPFVSTKPSGSGLGLAICSQIVERHGGKMSAHNEPTGGAAILVSLPLKIGD